MWYILKGRFQSGNCHLPEQKEEPELSKPLFARSLGCQPVPKPRFPLATLPGGGHENGCHFRRLVRDHTASEGQSQHLNPGLTQAAMGLSPGQPTNTPKEFPFTQQLFERKS